LFLKITHDGTDLGAKKRVIIANDLVPATESIKQFQKGQLKESKIAHAVSKQTILDSGDYNLSGDRYRISAEVQSEFDLVELGDLIEEQSERIKETKNIEVWSVSNKDGFVLSSEYFDKQVASADISDYKMIKPRYFAYNPSRINVGSLAFNNTSKTGAVSPMYVVFSVKKVAELSAEYLFSLLKSEKLNEFILHLAQGAVRQQLRINDLKIIKIPLPPFEIQKKIVAELDGYAGIIAGSKQIAQNWKPKIDIDPEWKKMKLGDVSDVRDGTHDSPKQVQEGYPLITSKNIKDGQLDFSNVSYISEEDFKKVSQRSYVDVGDIIMPMIGTIGGACLVKSKEIEFAIKNVALFKKSEQIMPEYLLNILDSDLVATIFENQSVGATQKFVSLGVLRGLEFPLPSIEIQKQIVEKIEAERALVESVQKLIDIYEAKTKEAIAKLWAE
jgi:type I restriction enzyme M protein